MIQQSPFRFSPHPNRAGEAPWMEYGPDAFARARAEDRPILLSISAVWSHWSQVMDETTYSDQRVLDRLVDDFVCVRVDADERPDLDARYNAGGWPTTAFLTPDGEVITALTFLRPEQMIEVLDRVRERWQTSREGIEGEIADARDRRQERMLLAVAGGFLTPEMLDRAVERLEARYDRRYGGFEQREGVADEQKFADAEALRLLLYTYRRRDHIGALDHARFTLDEIARGHLYDVIEGGFFRYAARPDWSEPQYEKLARDQGRLLLALGELALIDEEARSWILPVVEQTADYMDRALGEASGGFRGSQEADPAYYEKDTAGRDAHGAPLVDRRVYASSTALIARGLLQCGVALGRREWVDRGLIAVDFLVSEMRAGEAGMYHLWDGEPHVLGMLEDQVQVLLALLHAYEMGGAPGYLDHATTLARLIERDWREPGGVFLDTAAAHDESGLLSEPRAPLRENAEAAEAFLWLARFTHDERLLRTAHEVLSRFAGSFEQDQEGAPTYARVVDRMLSAEPEFKIVAESPRGEPDRVADPLHQRALRLPLASKTVQRLSYDDREMFERLRIPGDRSRVAYICVGTVCSAPIADPDLLAGAVDDIMAAAT